MGEGSPRQQQVGEEKSKLAKVYFFFLFPWPWRENNRGILKQTQQILVRLLFPSSTTAASV
jgi:hypothetical protein